MEKVPNNITTHEKRSQKIRERVKALKSQIDFESLGNLMLEGLNGDPRYRKLKMSKKNIGETEYAGGTTEDQFTIDKALVIDVPGEDQVNAPTSRPVLPKSSELSTSNEPQNLDQDSPSSQLQALNATVTSSESQSVDIDTPFNEEGKKTEYLTPMEFIEELPETCDKSAKEVYPEFLDDVCIPDEHEEDLSRQSIPISCPTLSDLYMGEDLDDMDSFWTADVSQPLALSTKRTCRILNSKSGVEEERVAEHFIDFSKLDRRPRTRIPIAVKTVMMTEAPIKALDELDLQENDVFPEDDIKEYPEYTSFTSSEQRQQVKYSEKLPWILYFTASLPFVMYG